MNSSPYVFCFISPSQMLLAGRHNRFISINSFKKQKIILNFTIFLYLKKLFCNSITTNIKFANQFEYNFLNGQDVSSLEEMIDTASERSRTENLEAHFPLMSISYKSSLVQSLSHAQQFATPWTAAWQASHSITNSWRLLKLTSIELVIPSNHLILCCPLLLMHSSFPNIRVFSNESVLHIRFPKYWSFCFSISPSSEYSGLIFFRMDWFDLLAVQGTLKSLFQHQNSKPSVLRC